MDRQTEVIGVVLMLVGVFAVAALNDRRKRKSVEKAWKEGRRPNPKHRSHRTDWILVGITTVIVFAAVLVGPIENLSPEWQNTIDIAR